MPVEMPGEVLVTALGFPVSCVRMIKRLGRSRRRDELTLGRWVHREGGGLLALRAVLFDFGGTLDADGVHWVDRFRAAYASAGLSLSAERFNPVFFEADRRLLLEHDMRGRSFRDLLEVKVDLLHEGLGIRKGLQKSQIVESFYSQAKEVLERNRLILDRLSQRYRLGVVSNFCGNMDEVCREFGLSPYLQVIVDSFVVKVSKPDPRIFQLALRGLGVSAHEAVLVGDNFERDVLAARAVGLRSIWLRAPEGGPPVVPLEPGQTIRSLTELEDILLGARAPEGPGLRRAGILAAGEGSRLRAAGLLAPKPLVEVGGVPLIERTLRGLVRAGAREVFCIVNEEAREVERFLLRGDFGARVAVLVKTTPSSLSSLLALKEPLSGEGFLLATADTVLDPEDWVGFAQAASGMGRAEEALLGATTFVDDEDPLWLRASPSGEVLALGPAAKGSGCVTSGLYAFPPDVFQAAEETAKGPGARLRNLLIDLLRRGWRLRAHLIRKAVDVDRPEDIRAAEAFLQELEEGSWRGRSSAS